MRSVPADIGAFIFDVDGVIADTAPLHAAAWRRLAEEVGLPFDESLVDVVRGLSRADALNKLLAGRPVDPRAFEEMMARKNRYFVASLETLGPGDLLPGVAPLVDALTRLGVKLAAASVSRNARTVLRRVGLTDCFEAIIDGRDIAEHPGGPGRLALAAAALCVAPRRCIVVEDAAPGIAAARQLGMRTIGIGSPDRLPAADLLFHSLRGVEAGTLLHWLSRMERERILVPAGLLRWLSQSD
ncbi:MAG: beta-phosphoglucomutase family hydrolase [Phycisphaerae bacterium]